ncbi:MAG: hypothetical protein NZ988_06380 [Thaumarchaeota archaeon]|nr:hypothetical protein [Candidatus Calditenuaceae archaeon]MDW8187649.1 hypothetical protein [Nitrososphaerota archaeon]
MSCEREVKVLKVFQDRPGHHFRFNELRLLTGLHQEVLSRVLRRLREACLVCRTTDGYYHLCACRSPDDCPRCESVNKSYL